MLRHATPRTTEPALLRRPRALLVDLDETLLDNSGIPDSVAKACDSVAAAFDGLDAGRLLEANTEAWRSYGPEVEQACWLGRMDGFSVSLEAWRRTLHAGGCTDESIVTFAFDQHRQFGRHAHRLFPDVLEFLAHVGQGKFRLALVTNGPSDLQRDRLRALALEETFEAVVISGELGVAKPGPAPFQVALERLGITPRDVWHVGDSLGTDVGGARAAGVLAVWLNRTGQQPGDGVLRPDIEVASLSQLTQPLHRAESTPTGT